MIGKYGITIAALLITMLVRYMLTFFALVVSGESFALYTILVIAASIFMGIFASGSAYLYLNIVYDGASSFIDIFNGFSENPIKAILIQMPLTLTSIAMQMPYVLYGTYYNDKQMLIVATIILFILYIIVSIAFSQSFYLLQDFPKWKVTKILAVSTKIMRKNFFTYIKLFVSFIPFVILGIITLGVPLLWVLSYMNASFASLYKEISKKEN